MCMCVIWIYRQHIRRILVLIFLKCLQPDCNRPLTIQSDLRPNAGHLGWSYSVYRIPSMSQDATKWGGFSE